MKEFAVLKEPLAHSHSTVLIDDDLMGALGVAVLDIGNVFSDTA